MRVACVDRVVLFDVPFFRVSSPSASGASQIRVVCTTINQSWMTSVVVLMTVQRSIVVAVARKKKNNKYGVE